MKRRPGVRGGLRRALLAGGLVAAGCMGGDGAVAQGAEGPEALLREGRYDEAIELLEGRAARDPSPAAARALAEALREVGELDRAEGALRAALERGPDDGELLLALGELLLETGRLDHADDAFRRAEAAGGPGALLARYRRGEILLRRGEREAAHDLFDGFIDAYNRSASLSSPDLLAVAGAVRHLGVRRPELFRDALRAYDEAIAADSANLEARLALGDLFLEKYNAPDARQTFREVLERRSAHPRAHLGLARVAEFEGSPEATTLVEQALETNPNLVGALVLRGRLHLAAEDLAAAEEDLERALEVNPSSPGALAVLAGARLVAGDREGYGRLRDRALGLNPRDAGFFVQVAELAARARLYHDAAELAGRGVEMDSLAWQAFGVQGLNQIRTGRMEEGRRNLEEAFQGDPFNVWIKNTLDLLDLMDEFHVRETERVRVLVDPEDGDALALYMLDVAEEAYDDLAERYGYRPEPPVRIEAFRRSADFSVRAMGLTGIGALGVSFGTVLAMDSPSARGESGFPWASVLRHEMAHAVHLGMTEHRIPRWLSEGLAVVEERRAGDGWGSRPSLPFLIAYLEERLRPPSELSRSFVRPRSPQEVGFAYVLSSLVAEWIEEEWGFGAVLAMLSGYGDGLTTDAVIAAELGLGPEELDRRFDAWFRNRYATPLEAAEASLRGRGGSGPEGGDGRGESLRRRVEAEPRDVEAQLELGRSLLSQGRSEEALPHLEAARELFPGNPDPVGPNRLLARIHRERGDEEEALMALQAHLSAAGGDREARLELARLQESRGDLEAAAWNLQAAIHIQPFEPEVHERLAELYRELGEAAGEVRERRVLLALRPADRAGALYRLAEAQLAAGEREAARRSVLEALELAPRFPEAQELLLRIMEGGGGDEGEGGDDPREGPRPDGAHPREGLHAERGSNRQEAPMGETATR